MLLVPYSSIIETMFWRKPVRIEAMVIAVMTPITIPRTVRKLRNLCERTLSSAIRSVSVTALLGNLSFIYLFRQQTKTERFKIQSLQVGKGGLPPLSLSGHSTSGGKPPFPTLSLPTLLHSALRDFYVACVSARIGSRRAALKA